MDCTPGRAATVTLVVTPADLAPAWRSGDVPVLATPRLAALCEEATVAAVAPCLADSETTVGLRLELDHLAPSRVGTSVAATAVLAAPGPLASTSPRVGAADSGSSRSRSRI